MSLMGIETIKENESEQTPDAYIEAKYIKPGSDITKAYEWRSSTTYKGMNPQLNSVNYDPFYYNPKNIVDYREYPNPRYLLSVDYFKCDIDLLIELEKEGISIPYEQLIEGQRGMLRPTNAIELISNDGHIEKRITNLQGLEPILSQYRQERKDKPAEIFNYYKYRTGTGIDEFANAMLIYKMAGDPNIPNLRALEMIAAEHSLPLNLNALTKGVVTLISKSNVEKFEEARLINDKNRGSLYKAVFIFSLMVNDRYMEKRSHSSSNLKFLTPYPLSIEENDYPQAEILPYLFFAFEAFLDKSNLPYIIKEGENYPLETLQSQIINLFEFAQKVIKLNGGASNELINILKAQSVVFNDIFEYYRADPKILNRINNFEPTIGRVPSVAGFREKLARFGATRGSKR
jgi:hypothetical protein